RQIAGVSAYDPTIGTWQANQLGRRGGGDVAYLHLTVPDVQISRFRFFTGELRSQRCSGGQSGLLVEGAAFGDVRQHGDDCVRRRSAWPAITPSDGRLVSPIMPARRGGD